MLLEDPPIGAGLLHESGLASSHVPMEPAEAERLALTVFGVSGTARRYATERDDTFAVEGSGPKLVLKVAHPQESADEIAFQVALMEYIAEVDPSLPVPPVIRTLDDRPWTTVRDEAGQERVVRMIGHLAGTGLTETTMTGPDRVKVGAMLGRLRRATEGFTHPGEDRVLAWDVRHVVQLSPLLGELTGERRALVAACLDRLGALQPRIDALPRQVLHNDFNQPNLIVDHEHPEFVTGVIDFGDAVRTAVAVDIATALVDHLPTDPSAYGQIDDRALFAAPAEVLAGYLDVADLDDEEVALVPHLMMARATALAVITTSRARLFPENADYILRTAEQTWSQLAWYLSRSVEDVSAVLADPTAATAYQTTPEGLTHV